MDQIPDEMDGFKVNSYMPGKFSLPIPLLTLGIFGRYFPVSQAKNRKTSYFNHLSILILTPTNIFTTNI